MLYDYSITEYGDIIIFPIRNVRLDMFGEHHILNDCVMSTGIFKFAFSSSPETKEAYKAIREARRLARGNESDSDSSGIVYPFYQHSRCNKQDVSESTIYHSTPSAK